MFERFRFWWRRRQFFQEVHRRVKAVGWRCEPDQPVFDGAFNAYQWGCRACGSVMTRVLDEYGIKQPVKIIYIQDGKEVTEYSDAAFCRCWFPAEDPQQRYALLCAVTLALIERREVEFFDPLRLLKVRLRGLEAELQAEAARIRSLNGQPGATTARSVELEREMLETRKELCELTPDASPFRGSALV